MHIVLREINPMILMNPIIIIIIIIIIKKDHNAKPGDRVIDTHQFEDPGPITIDLYYCHCC